MWYSNLLHKEKSVVVAWSIYYNDFENSEWEYFLPKQKFTVFKKKDEKDGKFFVGIQSTEDYSSVLR